MYLLARCVLVCAAISILAFGWLAWAILRRR